MHGTMLYPDLPPPMVRLSFLSVTLLLSGAARAPATTDATELTAELCQLKPDVLTTAQAHQARTMVARDLDRRTRAANRANLREWEAIGSRAEWEAYRDERIKRLRKSIGLRDRRPLRPPRMQVAATIEGDGFRIQNLLYESRPGIWVTASLYLPAQPGARRPALIIAHSHHRPRTQGELQDMGMTWARRGCLVLIPDHVGHGERRIHPFRTQDDFDAPFPVSRQDYYFRFDLGIELHLIGESLMGWMVGDLIRGIDVLAARDDVDPQRIILLGAVAGGGDPAAITAAVDQRVAACVPFNFGGPQPETPYPLPEDAEQTFNYLGDSYWESTRNLRRTAVDGFFHWLIVGAIAPRGLIYAHEFSWDRQRDPVWKRYERIYGEWYGDRDHLAFAHGKGLLRLRPPAASHCNQIGALHRRMIHPVFRRWFGIDVRPEDEYQGRLEAGRFTAFTETMRRKLKPRRVIARIERLGATRARKRNRDGHATARRAALAGDVRDARQAPSEHRGAPTQEEVRETLRAAWRRRLGPVTPRTPPTVIASRVERLGGEEISVERVALRVEETIVVPLLMLVPRRDGPVRPAVVAVAQSGKARFLQDRRGDLALLLRHGHVVCLPDLRGTGETRGGEGRDRTSVATDNSVNLLRFGETMLGQRLRDLRSVLEYVRARKDTDPDAVSLWGDSFAAPHPHDVAIRVPRGIDRPHPGEPLGGILVVLAGLYDDRIPSIYARGGLVGYGSVLGSPFVYVPHDVVVPGALLAGDLADIVAALAPRCVQLDRMIDGRNRAVSAQAARAAYREARVRYQNARADDALRLDEGPTETAAADWLLGADRAAEP